MPPKRKHPKPKNTSLGNVGTTNDTNAEAPSSAPTLPSNSNRRGARSNRGSNRRGRGGAAPSVIHAVAPVPLTSQPEARVDGQQRVEALLAEVRAQGAPQPSERQTQQEQRKRRERRAEGRRVAAERQRHLQEAERQRLIQEEAERQRLIQEETERQRLLDEERRRAEQEKRQAAERRKAEQELRRLELARQRREATALAKRKAAEAVRERREAAAREARAREEELARARERHIMETQAAETLVSVVSGAIVSFSAGLEVRNIVTGFECCKIVVKNVPLDVNLAELVPIFIQHGLDPAHFHVVGQQCIRGRNEVTIVAHGDAAANILADHMDSIELRGQLLALELGVFNGIGGMGSHDPKTAAKLRITFFAPSARFVAEYADAQTAEAMFGKLNGRRVQNRIIRVTPGRVATTIVLNNLAPEYAQQIDEVEELAESQNIRALPGNFLDVDDDATRIIQECSHDLPSVTVEVVSRGENGAGLAIIVVSCQSWEDAAELNRTLLRSGKFTAPSELSGQRDRSKMRVELPDPCLYTIYVPSAQYRVQERLWHSLENSNSGTDRTTVRLNIKNLSHSERHQIQVAGSDKLAVGALKVRVERLAEGTTVPGWHPALAHPSAPLMASIAAAGACLRADTRKKTLKVYGTPAAIDAAIILVVAALDALNSAAQTVTVPPSAVHFFRSQAVPELQGIFGDDNVKFDPVKRSITVVAKGGENVSRAVQRLVDRSKNFVRQITDQDEKVCQICYDTPTAPRTFLCSHVYCTSCLRHLFTSAIDADSVPLLCMGDAAQCRAPFPLAVIREFLAPAAWNTLLEVAFHAHIDKRPQEFRPCGTPDCEQIYRLQEHAAKLSCPGCFSEICAACGEEAHSGMTCEDYRASNDKEEHERLTEAWLAGEQETKRCPRCSVLITRIAGCNHMQCRCGAHLCWRCLASFSGSTETYAHMRNAHGGIYDEDMEPIPPPAQPAHVPAAPPPNARQQEAQEVDDFDPFLGADYREQFLIQQEIEEENAAEEQEEHEYQAHIFGFGGAWERQAEELRRRWQEEERQAEQQRIREAEYRRHHREQEARIRRQLEEQRRQQLQRATYANTEPTVQRHFYPETKREGMFSSCTVM
ncbi:hypothetical protein CYLTODRAFT_389049 [Cylindrobasidium torrendii FP15055 ss-10]|uniref:RBR-type E3 ubiquitin transferase n=1 Tax=Cylindrobasidium torrendii FP15055 ss-10 TaxID=1314674 RepID=A0A0D7BPS4_9AGAR|nr:hypothetical protein CYLTODRAFT_389049 [Cylindrobasidium torrendii FP15055 ss-10]